MSFKEMKKREKGKEISANSSTSFDHPQEVSMYFSEQEIEALLEANLEKQQYKKENTERKSSSSSKITPCIFYTSDDKARLRWSSDLHDCFVNAVEKLGGPEKATPKSVKEMMEVEGIALHHVKSHLQKFRLGKCNIQDGTDQCSKRFKPSRGIIKTDASSNSSRPQVNIRPKVAVPLKPQKANEVQGSLYMLIEHDLHLQRCRETERMQMAFAIDQNNHNNMLEAQYFEASMAPSTTNQHNNYISTESQHVYTSLIHSTQSKLQFSDIHNYNMAQGFINQYVTLEQESMHGSSSITTHQQELQLNNEDCLSHNSYHNATFLPTTVPPTIDSFYQGTSNNTIPFSTIPQSIQAYMPDHTYNSYPPYNTLEVVKAQLNALQNSSSSRIGETTSHETNLLSSVTRDEVDPVDQYIDWCKVEEMDINELDPVEVLEALGFGVSP